MNIAYPSYLFPSGLPPGLLLLRIHQSTKTEQLAPPVPRSLSIDIPLSRAPSSRTFDWLSGLFDHIRLNMKPASLRLDLLGLDVLLPICRFVDEFHGVGGLYPGLGTHPLRPLSLVNNGLRDICVPMLFRKCYLNIMIQDLKGWSSILEEMQWTDRSLVLGTHVR